MGRGARIGSRAPSPRSRSDYEAPSGGHLLHPVYEILASLQGGWGEFVAAVFPEAKGAASGPRRCEKSIFRQYGKTDVFWRMPRHAQPYPCTTRCPRIPAVHTQQKDQDPMAWIWRALAEQGSVLSQRTSG